MIAQAQEMPALSFRHACSLSSVDEDEEEYDVYEFRPSVSPSLLFPVPGRNFDLLPPLRVQKLLQVRRRATVSPWRTADESSAPSYLVLTLKMATMGLNLAKPTRCFCPRCVDASRSAQDLTQRLAAFCLDVLPNLFVHLRLLLPESIFDVFGLDGRFWCHGLQQAVHEWVGFKGTQVHPTRLVSFVDVDLRLLVFTQTRKVTRQLDGFLRKLRGVARRFKLAS